MKKFREYITEATKPSFGTDSEFAYAVKIDGLDTNEFYKQSFGRALSDMKKAREFTQTAKTDHVNAKGKATLAAVKAWVSANKPKEFYAKWQKDSSHYKDDSVEIYYK